MVLIKCKCGCHFTIKSIDSLKIPNSSALKDCVCQNCKNLITFNLSDNIDEINERISESGFSIYNLPDNNSLEVRFLV